jgi:hypothetical protein
MPATYLRPWRRRAHPRWTGAWIAAGLLLVLTPATAAAAPAALGSTATAQIGQTITAHRAGSTNGRTAADAITCQVKANYPHRSGHVAGTVNAVITTRCSAPVSRIVGTMSLYRNGSFVADGDGSRAGSAAMDMNAATACISGAYHSFGGVSITYPPGYVPSFDDAWVTSPTVPISCNTTTKYWVDTFADAPGSSSPGGPRTGTLYAGTNYVYCKVWGPKVQHGSDYNHWWLLTDLDAGNPRRNQYVSAYYLARWGNDVAKDNRGVVIPNC